MKIVLGEIDIVQLVVTAMELDVPLEEVVVRYDPLEIHIDGVEKFFKKSTPVASLPRKSEEPPATPSPVSVLGFDELLRANTELSYIPPDTEIKDSAQHPRRLRAHEVLEIPPPSQGGREV